MANIDLGTFTFDAQAVDAQIERLRKEMFALRAESKEYANQNKDLEKTIAGVVKEQNDLLASGKQNSKQYKDNEKLLEALVKTQYDVFKSQQQTSESQKKVNAEYKQATSVIKSMTDAEGNLVSSTQAINVALEKEVKSIADARASNKELLALRNQLDIAGGENEEALKELNAALDRNNAFIKENVSAYEQQKIGIGDYQTAIENALGGTKLFGVGLNDVKSQLANFAPVLNLIKGELTSIKDSFKTATTATQSFSGAQKAMAVTTAATSGALKLFRVALISTGIGAIVAVLGSLIAYLSSTQAGIDLVTKVTRPLSAIFQTLIGILQEVGEFLFEAFSNPQETIKELYDFIKNQVMRQFESFGKILEGIFTLDFGKIKEGFSDLADQARENIDLIAGAAQKVGERFEEAYKKGQRIDELQKKQEQKEIDIIAYRAEQEIQLKRLENIQKNQLLSAEERNKAIEEGERISKELVARENEILDIQIEQLKIKQSLNDTSREEEKQLQELIAQRISNESKILDVEKRALGDKKQLYEQEKNARIAAIKKVQDEAIKANQEQLDLFLAQQGFYKKSAEEQLQIARTKRDKEIEILEQELEYKRITLEKFNAEKIKINNEYLELERDLVIQNAEQERDEMLKNIEQRKTDYLDYTEEKLQIDIANAQDRLQVEQDFAQQQLEQGVINLEEYNAIIAEKKAEARDAELEAQMAFDEANKERLLIDAENERILAEQKYNDEFELKKFRLEQQRLAEVANAEKTGADVTLINEKYANQRMEIDRLQQENKIQLASDAFNNIASILGKESAVGKAVAIAQTTIDTYKSATAAYSALAGITIVGPVLGALAAGAAVAAGLANVKKIVSSKPPTVSKAERGMRVPRWGTLLKGRSHKQGGIPIEAEGGEAIINKRSTAMFGNLLSAINVAGGGIPLAARGAIVGGASSRNANIQSRLLQDANSANMSEMVAEAVREGSMEGSALGSRAGSQDGIIGLSENRTVQQASSF
jgi:hypothetical protein